MVRTSSVPSTFRTLSSRPRCVLTWKLTPPSVVMSRSDSVGLRLGHAVQRNPGGRPSHAYRTLVHARGAWSRGHAAAPSPPPATTSLVRPPRLAPHRH